MSIDNNYASTFKQGKFGGIREVARLAEVSTATVSRVFNQPDSVKSETRGRVLGIADRLNYIPDNAARSLGSNKNLRVGALIPSMDDSIFARFIGALQQQLSKKDYNLLIGVYDFNPINEIRELRSLIESGVDGIVFCGLQRSNELYEMLERRNIPFVNANIFDSSNQYPCVGPDYSSGISEITQYLINLGHRDIGLIDFTPSLNDRAGQRLAGIKTTLEKYDIELPRERYVERSFSIEDGRIGLRTLLENNAKLTAVVCGNDVLAVGALFEARDQCIDVPGELSISGFDNLALAAQVKPGLTTVNVPTAEMGARVAQTLLSTIQGKSISNATRITCSLIVRGSTGPPQNR